MLSMFKGEQGVQRGQIRASREWGRVGNEVEKRWGPVVRHSEDAGILSQ